MLIATLALAPVLFASPPKTARPEALVLVSWDGAADWVVDRLVQEGKLPTVARMAREGAMADAIRPAFPSKTAVSHFTLFSGSWPAESFVTSNEAPRLPRSEHTISETIRGFDGSVHATEPLWVTAAKAGANVLALSAAGSYPPGPDQARLKAAGVPLERFREFSGFESNLTPNQVVTSAEQPVRLAETTVKLALRDDPRDPKTGWDTLEVEAPDLKGRNRVFRLKPFEPGTKQAWSPPILIRKGTDRGISYLRLFDLDPKTGKMVLYVRSSAAMKGTESSEVNWEYLQAYGGFHDDPFGPYQNGLLGPTLYDPKPGDGLAEKRALDVIAMDLELAKRSFRYGWRKWRSQLVFHYTPMSDSAGHCWMGLLDPALSSHRPEVATKLWPYYEQVYQLQDAWLADMMRVAGPRAAFALVSDHGMAGSDKEFQVNEVLKQAGLVAVGENGAIDLTRTKALSPPWSEFFVCVNGTDRKGGIVPPAEREAVLAAAEKALLAAKDEKGKAIVTRVFRAESVSEFRFGGPAGGDLAFELQPGVYPRARFGQVLAPRTDPRKAGVHGYWPEMREMHSIGYFHGPGLAKGSRLRRGTAADLVPTVCAWMGWPVPAGAVGTTLMSFR